MIDVAVIGAAGYTGGELLRILLQHPYVKRVVAISQSHGGKSLCAAHPDLLAWRNLNFVADMEGRSFDVVFLCGRHGEAQQLIDSFELTTRTQLIIDLSQDFRLAADGHSYVYGFPEAFSADISRAKHIANPGCFATAIQLALLPLARKQMLTHDLHITGLTGSTGAGQKLDETLHFSWRSSNVSVYKPFQHQHEAEVLASMRRLQPDMASQLCFIPMRGPFPRGILVSMHTQTKLTPAQLTEIYLSEYESSPFVFVVDQVDLKQVVNSNQAVISCQQHGEYTHIVCALDNLLKGASGQAVQNMNIALGLPQNQGLSLKSSAF